jgi:hypothetical protein
VDFDRTLSSLLNIAMAYHY